MPEKPVRPSAKDRAPSSESEISRGEMRPDAARSRKKAKAEKPASRVWSRSKKAPTSGPAGLSWISRVRSSVEGRLNSAHPHERGHDSAARDR
jgi:hypothetical protein